MTAFPGGFGVQGGWGWLHAALRGVVFPYEGNSAILAGDRATVGLIAMSQGAEFIQY